MRHKLRKILTCLFLLLLLIGKIFSQSELAETKFVFLPEQHQFRSLVANPQEAHLGLWKFFSAEQMKVEIGAEQDLFSFQTSTSSLNIGINFFGYANVTGANGLHLQIDALDGFFGGNISLVNSQMQYRLRILHHSAHLVDGNWWASYPRDWTKPGGPIPFTRDFGEIVAAKMLSFAQIKTRLYGGVSFATFFRPNNINRTAFLSGIEIHSPTFTGTFLHKKTNLFATAHISWLGIRNNESSLQTKCGIKFGEWEKAGILLYFATSNGRSFFAEYLFEKLNTYGMGFEIDFP